MIPTITGLTSKTALTPKAKNAITQFIQSMPTQRETEQDGVSIVRRGANDTDTAFIKTMDRMMERHNYNPVDSSASNDSSDTYAKTMDRMMDNHNYHPDKGWLKNLSNDDEEDDFDPDSSAPKRRKKLKIYAYREQIPQSRNIRQDGTITRPKKSYVASVAPSKKSKNVSTDEDDVESKLSNIEDNTAETAVGIATLVSLFDDIGVDSLRDRERDIESGKGYIAGRSGLFSSMALEGKDKNPEDGLLASLAKAAASTTAGIVMSIGGILAQITGDALGAKEPEKANRPESSRAENMTPSGALPTKSPKVEDMTSGKVGGTLSLSQKDIIDIKKTLQTEWIMSSGEQQGMGIVDTILNRQASGKWGRSVEDVVNAKHQFSAINGPQSEGRKSVNELPDSFIRKDIHKFVDEYLKKRAQGAESSVGDNLNYANPYYSDRKNRPWVEALDGPRYGKGKSIHYHGTVPELEKNRPGTYALAIPGHVGNVTPSNKPEISPSNGGYFSIAKSGFDATAAGSKRVREVIEQNKDMQGYPYFKVMNDLLSKIEGNTSKGAKLQEESVKTATRKEAAAAGGGAGKSVTVNNQTYPIPNFGGPKGGGSRGGKPQKGFFESFKGYFDFFDATKN